MMGMMIPHGSNFSRSYICVDIFGFYSISILEDVKKLV
jgi:hypothetical protein